MLSLDFRWPLRFDVSENVPDFLVANFAVVSGHN